MPRPTERFILWTIDEATLGQDHNGDFDALDFNFTLFDAKADETVETGLAGKGLPNNLAIGALSNEHALMLVSEQDQGSVDLNGDGDSDDFVLHWYDGRTGAIRNVGVACENPPSLVSGFALIPINEIADNRDWSGDGVLAGEAWVVADIENDRLVSLGLVHLSGGTSVAPSQVSVVDGKFRFPVSENGNALMPVDITGNGNTTDVVSALLDPRTGTLRFTPFPTRGFVRDILGHELDFVDEGIWKRDLNGDGAIVLGQYYLVDHDLLTGAILSVPIQVSLLDGFSSPTVGQGVLINGNEGLNGDQNGDGDSVDTFIWVYDVSMGVGNLLPNTFTDLAASIDPRSFFLVIPEGEDAVDYNGDGDQEDQISVMVDIGTAAKTIIPIATAKNRESAGELYLLVDEAAQAGTDWNGDGDATDLVWATFDFATGRAQSLGVAGDSGIYPTAPTERRAGRLVISQESTQSFDWNGDGDLDDDAIVLVSREGNLIQSTGETILLDTANFSGLAGVQLDSPAIPFFLESERDQGCDLDGDGRLTGIVLRVLRIR